MKRALGGEEGRRRVAQAIAELEQRTAAEVVVSVHPASGRYRDADLLFGFLVAEGVLAALLFAPPAFALWAFPLDTALAFAVGAILSAHAPPLRRLLTSRRRREAEVVRAARAAFVAGGVGETSGRTGVLVYVSFLERRVELVADVAAAAALGEEGLARARALLQAALAGGGDLERFLAALAALGDELALALPRTHDDRNELPDAVRA